ncbi:MAG TPA: response regulator [Steroidobacteraceae bacterium]|nr:response regulator [Steroidobacteraceae bacterium]
MLSPSANQSIDERQVPAHDTRAHCGSRRKPKRILVADDNRDAAESCALLLSMDGHEVVSACDGASAWDCFQRFEPDVAILDIAMPSMSGHELARCIRRSREHRRVLLIAISGWVRASDRDRCFEAGFDHYLAKPVDYEELNRLL